MAVMAIISGASVYADQTNVSPGSILYPLKRTQEFMRLLVTAETEKPALHLKLAERRLLEIQEVRDSDPESPKISRLTNDLREEVKNSLITINNNDIHEDKKEGGDGGQEKKKELELKVEVHEKEKQEKSENLKEPKATVPGTRGESQKMIPQPADGKEIPKITPETIEPASSSLSAPTALREQERDKKEISEPRPEGKEKSLRDESPKELPRGKPPASKKTLSICESWGGLIRSKEEGVKTILDEHPEFLRKFERKCLPFVGQIESTE